MPCCQSSLPSGARIIASHLPPGRRSSSTTGAVKPSGPHQFFACTGSDHTFQRRSRGASKVRLMTSVFSAGAAARLFAVFEAGIVLLLLKAVQIFVQPIEAFFPEGSVPLDPIADVLERGSLESRWPPLSVAAARDEAGILQHSQVLGDGREAHPERLSERGDGGLSAYGEPGNYRAARGIGERAQDSGKLVSWHR